MKSHGATAKAERYLNATTIFARAVARLGGRDDITPVDFQSDDVSEVNARLRFQLAADNEAGVDAAQAALMETLEAEIEEHASRGARIELLESNSEPAETDEAVRLAAHLSSFLASAAVEPLLSEDSEGHQGYSNPYFVERVADDTLVLSYRLRAFDADELEARIEHVRTIAGSAEGGALPVDVEYQYVNMGPALAAHPQLVDWARDAAEAIGVESRVLPIRGGTGVDPFIEKGIPIANLGTGYFAPESEKEFTSRQMLSDHVVWLSHLVQVVALST